MPSVATRNTHHSTLLTVIATTVAVPRIIHRLGITVSRLDLAIRVVVVEQTSGIAALMHSLPRYAKWFQASAHYSVVQTSTAASGRRNSPQHIPLVHTLLFDSFHSNALLYFFIFDRP